MSFKDIYGHERQCEILRLAVERNRTPHAYLFYGMEGTGKKTIARRYAKTILCKQKNENFDACDRCSSCLKLDRKNHPDFITIKADGQFIRIKEIRYLQGQMSFLPLDGEKRVIIIQDADKMNNVSANAILKTIEEPKKSNLIILTTAYPHQIPATVLSRCRRLKFDPLPTSMVALFLQNTLSLCSEKANLIASSSGGSIRKALELAENSFMTKVTDFFEKFVDSHKKGPLMMLAMIKEFGQEKTDILDRLNILMTGFRDALVYKETGEIDRMINRFSVNAVKSLADNLSGFEILQNIRTVDVAMRVLGQNANKQLTLETMVFKLLQQPQLHK